MQRGLLFLFFSKLSLTIFGCLISLSVEAQVIPDDTTSTTVNQDGNNFTIEQGNRVGDNLFHSFDEFSVPTLGSAAFNNAGDIANIFSRVTGSNISSIDGLISANGAANLFLINPNGIIFGENASLNLGGSFFASTADSLLFEGDAEFSAVNSQAPPLLEVSIPIGLNFRDNPGDITVNQSILEVNPGNNLALVGGNLNIEGGELGFIAAPGGRIELGGLTAAGRVDINDDGSLNFPDSVARGDVLLSNVAFVTVPGDGGSINVNAGNLRLSENSGLSAGIIEGFGGEAGDINISATNEIVVSQGSTIENQVFNGGIGDAGNLKIQTGSLTITEGSEVATSTFGNGNGGNLTIDAKNTISVDGFGNEGIPSGIFSNVGSEDIVGNAGEIKITTRNLTLTNGGVVNATIFGEGNTGKVTINASDSIFVNGEAEDDFFNSGIFSSVQDTGKGNSGGTEITTSNLNVTNNGIISAVTLGDGDSGNINIQVRSLSLEDRGKIDASTFGQGDAGKVAINASDSVSLDSGEIGSEIVDSAKGNSGGIEITTGNLSLTNGSLISANTLGEGDAGKVAINASDSVSLDDSSGLASLVENTAKGNSGGVEVTTSNLSLTNGSLIDASTLGEGSAGKITINATDSVFLDGLNSVIFSEIDDTAKGNSDGIDITATNLSLTNGGSINSNSSGNGNSGKISINAADTIVVDGGSSIFNAINERANGSSQGIEINTTKLSLTNAGVVDSSTFGQGNAGKINIQAQSLSLEDGGAINSSTSGQGNGGGITIDVDDAVTITGIREDGSDSSQITTETFGEGDGGSIQITAQSLFLEKGGAINSSSNLAGDGGNITIDVDDSVTLNGESNNRFSSVITASSFSLVQFESGNGGNIEIKARDLALKNGAIISSGVSGVLSFAKPGDIIIDVDDSVTLDGENQDGDASTISTNTNAIKEDASDIRIQARFLSLENGAEISSSTVFTGFTNGGNITIDVDDSVTLNGESQDGSASRIATDTSGGANGGNIEIEARFLSLENGAEISSNITSGLLDLASGQGGNIDLQIADILSLRNNSKISAQASENANGGNITTDADLIIAFPNQNNDIFANATQGNGGNINITTQAIFGLEERRSTPPNQTNDIDASSEFGLQGDFSLNTPDFDPTTGLINLPASVGDASDQISQNPCEQGVGSEFIVTGKGGLPPNVNESLNSESAQVGLIETVPAQQQTVEANGETLSLGRFPDLRKVSNPKDIRPNPNNIHPNPSTTSEAVPAQGWVFNDNGEVTLTAYSTSGNQIQRSRQQHHSTCSSGIEP